MTHLGSPIHSNYLLLLQQAFISGIFFVRLWQSAASAVTYLAMGISWRFPRFKSYSKSKVSDNCCQIITYQDVFALEVPGKFQHKSIGELYFVFLSFNCHKKAGLIKPFSQSNVTSLLRFWSPLPVCNGGFGTLPLVVGDVFVEVSQTSGHGLCYMTQLAPGQSVTLQVVCQWALQAHQRAESR